MIVIGGKNNAIILNRSMNFFKVTLIGATIESILHDFG